MSSFESHHPNDAALDDLSLDEYVGRHRAPIGTESVADSDMDEDYTPQHGDKFGDDYEPRHADEYEPKHGSGEVNETVEDKRDAFAKYERDRYKSTELLNGSRLVAAKVSEYGVKSVSATMQAWATMRNAASSPRRGFRKFLMSRSERQVAKRERKLEMATDGLYKQRVQESLDGAKQKLDERKSRYDRGQNEALRRTETAKNYRSEEHQDFVDKLIDRRGAALLRKKSRKRLRNQGASLLESRRLSKELDTSENTRGAIDLVLAEQASRSDYKRLKRKQNRQDNRRNLVQSRISSVEGRATTISSKLESLEREISEYKALLPDLREQMEAAEEKYLSTDGDDAEWPKVEYRFNRTNKEYHTYQGQLRKKELEAKSYRKSLKRKQDTLEKHSRKLEGNDDQRQDTQKQINNRKNHYDDLRYASDGALGDLMVAKSEKERE